MEKSNIPGIGQADIYDYIPSNEEKKLIENFEKQAEKDIEELKQTSNIHFRWSEFETRNAISNILKIRIKTGNGC